MTAATDPGATERFRGLLRRHLGLQSGETRPEELAELLRQRAQATGSPAPGAYLDRLEGSWREELAALVTKVTVPETYFFRNPDHFRAFGDLLQGLAASEPGSRSLRVLSAGCASGEEAYSLAIVAGERLPSSLDVRVLGIDVNPEVVAKARRAVYPAWALRETPSSVQERYFRNEGRDFLLDQAVRGRVSFEERNLVEDDPRFWQRGAFDIIFCRNVTMYFSPDAARAVVSRLAGALVPGGYLFLGHAETLRGVSQDFHLRHTHDTFYYQRREESRPRAAPAPERFPVSFRPVPALLELGTSWVGAIQRASDRIAALAGGSGRRVDPRPSSVPHPGMELALSVELLRQDRFGDAMALLSALPAERQADPDVQILRAVLLLNGGDLPEAERACRRLLSLDELNAGAHYLMALCREHAGAGPDAAECDRAAAYLDPSFAMPHLHLGLASRRAGDLATARQELERALGLLVHEDPSRILLFGGGFSREALVDLCRAGLSACGEGP